MNPEKYTIQGSYRNQDYAVVIWLDRSTDLWIWSGTVEFDAGPHSLSSNRKFITAQQAEDHMGQSIYRCIGDNPMPLGIALKISN